MLIAITWSRVTGIPASLFGIITLRRMILNDISMKGDGRGGRQPRATVQCRTAEQRGCEIHLRWRSASTIGYVYHCVELYTNVWSTSCFSSFERLLRIHPVSKSVYCYCTCVLSVTVLVHNSFILLLSVLLSLLLLLQLLLLLAHCRL